MKRHFPPLRALRAFEATARLQSFQKAAKELNVTHSAISHQIKKLEEELGKPLFIRLGRTIALTDVAERYYVQIHDALNQIENSTMQLFGQPDQGDLTVQVYMGIASRWLMQRLGDFRQQYPRIHIELYSSYLSWDFEPNAADIGIIYSEKTESGMMYQQLFKGTLIPVCSPDLLSKFNTPGDLSIDDLLTLPFLTISESPKNLSYWADHQAIDLHRINVVSEHDNHQLALEAAIAGEGVAVVHSFFASGDLYNGKLVIPSALSVPEIGAWYLVQSAKTLSDTKIIYFANWLYKQIVNDPLLPRSI